MLKGYFVLVFVFHYLPVGDKAAYNENESWIMDSGCTSHLCNDASKFGDTLLPMSGKLNLATNSNTDVRGKGTVRLSTCKDNLETFVELPNTLYVPNLRCNLISVAKILDAGFSVNFEGNIASVNDSYGNSKLIANRKNNLFYVEEHSRETVWLVWLWHERLGHLNARDLMKILNKSDMKVKMSDVSELYDCDVCASGKMNALPFSKSDGPCDEKLNIVYSDVVGPIRHEAMEGAKYFVTFIDDHTRWCEVYLLRKKSDVLTVFKMYKKYVENLFEKKIKYLQTDNGGEYCNQEFVNFLKTEGISRRLTVPYTPQQNGVAERMNRTLVEMARCMLISSGLPSSFWADAIVTACHVRNRCPTSSLQGDTPYKKWFNKPVKINYLQKFGSKVHFLDKEQGKDKFANRGLEGIFVGYPRDRKGYRIWVPQQRKVIVSRDVKFHEGKRQEIANNSSDIDPFEVQEERSKEDDNQPRTMEVEFHSKNVTNTPIVNFQNEFERTTEVGETVPEESPEIPVEHPEPTAGPSDHLHQQVVENDDEGRKMKRAPGRPRLERGHVGRPRKIYHMTETEPEIPTERCNNEPEEFTDCQDFAGIGEINLKEALTSEEKENWEEAILSEIRSLVKNDTWDIIRKPAIGNVVGCRYVLTTKLNVDKTEKKKARLVAKGYSQRYGVDYHNTFAPVVRLDTIRLLVALSVELDMEIHQLDINTAYLNGFLEEQIYMKVPGLLEECLLKLLEREDNDSTIYERAKKMLNDIRNGGDVCRLKRSLYGLKQAGRQWNKRLDEQLKRMGLQSSLNEPCLYYKTIDCDTKLFVLVFVDDILIASQKKECIQLFKNQLATEFDLKDYGIAKFMLGIEFERRDNVVKLSQQKYIEDLVSKYGLQDCKNNVSTPMEVKTQLLCSSTQCEEDKQYPYRELIGSLMYLSTGTRPDISNSVAKLSQFLNCFNKQIWNAAKRVLRYLNKTKEFGIVYKKTGNSLVGYSDSDWGGCILDRCSYSSYAFLLGGGCISWKSQKQKCVATSTCEAEYVSLSSSMKEAIYLNSLLTEIGLGVPSSLLCGNTKEIELGSTAVAGDMIALALVHIPPAPSAQCGLRIIAPDAAAFTVSLIDVKESVTQWKRDRDMLVPGAPPARKWSTRNIAAQNTDADESPPGSNNTDACKLLVYIGDETKPNWRINLCGGHAAWNATRAGIQLLPPRIRIAWNPPTSPYHHTEKLRLVVTAVYSGTVCNNDSLFDCANTGICISSDRVCDGVKQCVGGEDEATSSCRHRGDRLPLLELLKRFAARNPELLGLDQHDDATKPSVIMKIGEGEQKSNAFMEFAAALKPYGPWSYLVVGMLVCATILMFCLAWECCCKRSKPSDTPIAIPASCIDLSPTVTVTGASQHLFTPPTVAPPEYEAPPSYSSLFPRAYKCEEPVPQCSSQPD